MNLRPLANATFLRTHFSTLDLVQRGQGVRLSSAFPLDFNRMRRGENHNKIGLELKAAVTRGERELLNQFLQDWFFKPE